MTTVESLDEMDAQGRIYFPKDGGWPRLIRLEEDSKGRAVGDVWEDIPPINMQARERLGYGKTHPHAGRILARAWVEVIWRCWQDRVPYDPARHHALQRVVLAQAA